MREIKFRGRRTDNGEWVYGSLIQSNLVTFIEGNIPPCYMRKVYPATVGQFTGWQDVDGTDIYEGDIVEFVGDKAYRGTIVYEGTSFMVKADGITDTLDSIDVEGQNLLLIDTIHGEVGE